MHATFLNIHGLTFRILCRRKKWEGRGRQKSSEQTSGAEKNKTMTAVGRQ